MGAILWAALAALSSGQGNARQSPLENGVVREVELCEPPGTLVQHFRLDREPAQRAAPPLGLLRWVSGPHPLGGLRAEIEVLFLEEGLKVIHSERASQEGRVLVYREVRERAGRTVFLEGSSESGYSSLELGAAESLRRTHPGRGELPLLLIAAAARGEELPGAASVFDPLSVAFEPLRLALDGRALDLLRADGSRRWRVSLQGGVPVEMRWQPGGPVARAITPAEHERLLGEHEARSRAAAEAAQAAAPLAER